MTQNLGDQIKLLKQLAPECSHMSELCKKAGISRPTIYRIFKKVITLKDTLEASFRTGVYVEHHGEVVVLDQENRKPKKSKTQSTKRETTKADAPTQTVVFSPRRQEITSTTPEDRLRLGRQICELVLRGSTVSQACEIIGIAHSTFYKWIAPNAQQYVPELKAEFEIARTSFNMMLDDEIMMHARKTLKQALTDREYKTVSQLGKIGEDGNMIVEAVKQETRTVGPSPALIRFALERLVPLMYGTPMERNVEDDVKPNDFGKKTLAELDKEEMELRKELGM